jgi:hypothetical protein
MWIIQEIVMAREVSVVCGGMMVEWDPFATTMKLLFHTVPRYLSIPQDGGVSIAAPGLRTVCYIYDLRVLRQEHRSLELPLALVMCQRFQATNPRDKIFGLLGISTDSKLLALTPDYNASVQEVYTTWTRHLLLNGAPLVLHIAGTGFSRKLGDLPSWVPDWSSIPKRESFGMAARAEFRAAGDSIMKVLPTQDPKSIIVEARHVATVSMVFPPCHLQGLTQNAAEQGKQWVRLLNWLSSIRQSTFTDTHYVDQDDAYWRTLIANITERGDAAPLEFRKCFLSFMEFNTWRFAIHCGVSNYLESPTKQVEQEFQRYFEAFCSVLPTEVFVTNNGYLGRSQPGVTKGDEVYIVSGTTTPFVLRKYGESGHQTGKRLIIGDCYVHGLMNGEGANMAAAQNVELF